jgi:hypothetical protein
MLRGSPVVVLALLLSGSVLAGVPGSAGKVAPSMPAKQLWLLGKRAVMHVYYYTPATLEITSVTSQFFKDVVVCERAVRGAPNVAIRHARQGDMVDAQCVAMYPPEAIVQPPARPSAQVTEL